MSRPTIIINDLDAERIDILLEQPAYAGFANRRRVKRRVGSRPNVFARRDATRRGDNEQPG
nr:regulator of nucleoside diphosphate kinase [uncultured bacterium]